MTKRTPTRHIGSVLCCIIALLFAAGCETPVGIERLDASMAQRRLTANVPHDRRTQPYFAFKEVLSAAEEIHPYFFQGKIESITRTETGAKVIFTGIR